MISVNDLRSGIVFADKGSASAKASADKEYFLVLSYEHIKMGRGSGTVKVKVKNLNSGATVEKSFTTGARIQEATLLRKKVKYLYKDDYGFHFMDMATYDQFAIDQRVIGKDEKFLKEDMEVVILVVDDKPFGVELPKIVEYKVVMTGGAARGNTASGAAYKDAKLENGLMVKVPLFIKIGDIVKINTQTGEYVERGK